MSLPFERSVSNSDFEVERSPGRTPHRAYKPLRRQSPGYDAEQRFCSALSALCSAKNRPFSVCGRIPLDPSQLVLFFRTKSGITHALDFPIDVEHDTPPALDVLIAACKPYSSADVSENYPEAIYYPPNLPLTATLEIANHPILDAVRNTLFPSLPVGHYLVAVRDKLEIIVTGGRMSPQPRALRNDTRVAMVVVTLPARFRGGALVVRDSEGTTDKFYGRGGKSGDMEWVAFLSDCEYEQETVQKGCKICISYAVYVKSHGPSGPTPDPLISPSDYFLDQLIEILNASRGALIGFYLAGDYGVNPAEVLADALVPNLKGGDSILYHALKLFKLAPELRWTAGGYIWPVDRAVECVDEVDGMGGARTPVASMNGARRAPAVRGTFSIYGDQEDDVEDLRSRVEDSGAIPIEESGITVLSDWKPGPMTREKVPFVSNGVLEKLIVNVLLVVYVP
ncbi:hypothetical protein OE88DRAFT_1627401 [Heliocybe sulcata]|uniref:Uncharacterized protein n=1 Tax=Heliocybe sulcata TaxID=5364 RepID=A0A5C3N6J5_9AGAM|nr:hypothetical protein OE88DRAFT_1627401 [Heliocybe sulcata]